MARAVCLFEDLLLGSNVLGTLRAAGHEATLCGSEAEAWEQAPGSDVLVVDLAAESFDGPTLLDSMRSGGELHGTRTLGVYAHVDVATRERAEAVGFDLVVPRSRMAREMAALVDGLLPPS